MSDVIAVIFSISLFVGIFALVFGLIIFMNKKLIQHYTALGEKLGLSLQVTKKFFGLNQFPVLSGVYKNQSVILSRYTVGHGKHKKTYTYISSTLADPGFEFSIAKEGFWNKLLGGQDVKCGDEEFDKTYFVKSKSEDQVRRIIDSAVRKVLMEVNASKLFSGNITFKKGDLRYTEMGDMVSEKVRNRFEAMMQVMPFLAGKIKG